MRMASTSSTSCTLNIKLSTKNLRCFHDTILALTPLSTSRCNKSIELAMIHPVKNLDQQTTTCTMSCSSIPWYYGVVEVHHCLHMINPRHMHHRDHSVCVSVSVCLLPHYIADIATYVIYMSKIPVICFLVVFSKFLLFVFCWKHFVQQLMFMVTSADHHCLPRSLKSSRWTKETAAASYQCKGCGLSHKEQTRKSGLGRG